VSEVFSVDRNLILNRQEGRQNSNIARTFAMFVCQEYQDLTLSQIAKFFDLKNSNSVSNAICRIRNIVANGDFKQEMQRVRSSLNVVEVT
jgi:chromosomal replication initiation ATPase DnaA